MRFNNPDLYHNFINLCAGTLLFGLGARIYNEVKDAKRAFLDENRENTTSATENILSFKDLVVKALNEL